MALLDDEYRVEGRPRIYLEEAAAAAGLGARRHIRSMCLVVEAADLLESTVSAKAMRGGTVPMKLGLIAERRDAPG